MLSLKEILIESLQSNKDIDIIVSAIEDAMRNILIQKYENVKKTYAVEDDEVYLHHISDFSIYFEDLKIKTGLSSVAKEMIKKWGSKVVRITRVDSTAKGEYISKYGIRIFKRNFKNEIHTEHGAKDFARDFINAIEVTLVHEVQHMYDDFISNGKYIKDKSSIEYYKERSEFEQENPDAYLTSNPELYKKYLKLQHEINARFQGFIRAYRGHMKNIMWKVIVGLMKNEINGFYLLNKTDQKRLISRLGQIYTEVNKNIITRPKQKPHPLNKEVSLNNSVNDLEQTLNQRYNPQRLRLHFSPDGNILEISELLSDNPKPIYTDLIRFADRHKLTLSMSVYANFTAEKDKVTVTRKLLRDLGFKRNKGRYINWYTGNEYIRPPKERKKKIFA